MKPIGLLVTVSLGVALGHAHAADLANTAPPLPSGPNWTGFYLGFHAGWGWAADATGTASSADASSPLFPFDPITIPLNSSGSVAGGQLGYNWQSSPRWVIGAEGDLSGTALKASQSVSTSSALAGCAVPGSACGSVTMTENVNWLASARGRIGYAAGPGLAYATGGAAFANVDDKANATQVFPVATTYYPVTASATKMGWVYGAGYEFMLGNDWMLRAEYLHYSFDGVSGTTAAVLPNPVVVPGLSASYAWSPLNLNILRLGLDYKF
jgi:outer membrane immunogenic protein